MQKESRDISPGISSLQVFQCGVEGAKSAQQLDSQHGQSHGTDEKRKQEQNRAVGDRVCNHNRHGKNREQAACNLEHKGGAGEQTGAQPDEQGHE